MSYVLEGPEWPSGPITWSFAAFNYAADSASPFSSSIAGVYQAVVEQAIQAWASISGLTFQQVADSPDAGAAADIRIGFGDFSPQTTGTLGYTEYSYTGQFFNKDIIVRLEDPSQLPIINSDGTLTYQGNQATLYQVILHELGHALGLGHSPDPSAVMYPVASTQNRSFDASDVAGINALYGSGLVAANTTISHQILLQNEDGSVAIWQMSGTTIAGGGLIELNPGTAWNADAVGDFFHDGKTDILWQNAAGVVAIWDMDGTSIIAGGVVALNPGPAWQIKGTGDFFADGKTDILWQNADGSVAIWDMDGTSIIGGGAVGLNPGPAWQIKGTGDFFADGKTDILLQNSDGSAAIWDMDGTSIIGGGVLGLNPGPSWHIKEVGDFYGDGKTDILWQNDSGALAIWDMNGTSIAAGGVVSTNPGPNWHSIGTDGIRFINGTSGTETLTASAGPNEFVLTSYTPGSHTIAGFDPTQDLIELSKALFASYSAVEAASTSLGNSTLFTLDPSSSLLLQGVMLGSLHSSNFVLV